MGGLVDEIKTKVNFKVGRSRRGGGGGADGGGRKGEGRREGDIGSGEGILEPTPRGSDVYEMHEVVGVLYGHPMG